MKLLNILILLKNGISKKWGQRPKPFGGTQSPRPETHLMGETQDPKGGTQDPELKGGTVDPEGGGRDPGCLIT